MTKEIARLLRIFTTLERKFGLSGLDPEERAIFHFIVAEIARGRTPTMQDILGAELTSRANAYRKVAGLKAAGLIQSRAEGNAQEFTLSRKLQNAGSSAEGVLRALAKAR